MDTSKLFKRTWRTVLLVFSLALVSYLLYFHRLTNLLPGYAAAEVDTYRSALTWSALLNDPINLPYTFFVWLAAFINHHTFFTTRMVAAVFGIVAVLTFYAVVRPRYRFWVAFTGTVLFATSAGFLHIARLGTPAVLQMSILILFMCITWYQKNRNHRPFTGYALATMLALACYIPGLIWFVLLATIVLYKKVFTEIKRIPTGHLFGWLATFGLLITPLIIACTKNPDLALTIAGLPTELGSVLTTFGSNLLNTVLSIGVRSDGSATLWLGHMPILNIIEVALGLIGAYCYFYRERTWQALLLGSSTILAIVLISLGGSITYAILVPLLYLYIIKGLSYLLRLWFTVFPRNPIARGTGVAVVTIMLFFSVLYHVRVYFVAWPHNNATRQTFTERQP